jgi:hypothetical protein
VDVARLCASKISQGDYALMVTRQNAVIAMVAASDLVLALQGGSVTPPLLPSHRGEAVRPCSDGKNLPYALRLCTPPTIGWPFNLEVLDISDISVLVSVVGNGENGETGKQMD